MARDCPPDGLAERACVEHRCDFPTRPGYGLPFDPVDRGGQFLDRTLIRGPCRFRPRDVIQLRNRWIGGGNHRGGCVLADRNMIRMSVGAVRPERDDDVWL